MEKKQQETDKKEHLSDFTRKSLVGAVYRVGASFTMDAIYLTAAGATGYYLHQKYGIGDSLVTAGKDFFHNLDPWKLSRVALFVVGINFVDYKFKVTDRLDSGTKTLLDKIKRRN